MQGGDSLTVYAGSVSGGPGGGTLRAQGGGFAAGIGGASGGSGGQLTVYGGTVFAQGGDCAAGIGGGDGGSGCDVAIYGGAVTGVACGGGVGIGSGVASSDNADGGLALGEGVAMYGKNSFDDPWGDPYGPASGGRRTVMSTEGGRTVTATFHANGHGSDPQAQAVPYLGRFAPPDPEPTDGEYAFAGWYADEGCEVPFDFGERAMADADVWAKWAEKQKQVIPVPAAATGLVYSGRPQAGVPAGEGYSVEGGEATGAGSYEATLTADSGHVFEGGSSTATVAWSIARKPVPVPAAATGLVYSGRPQVGVAGEGYAVRGGTATGAGGYTARCAPDRNHVWRDGTASEVEVAWSIARKPVPVPAAATGLVYSGRPQAGVAGEGCVVRGGTATGAGGYTARCAPDRNHEWQDGTASEVEVAWSIARAANPLRLAKASRTVSASKVGKAKKAVAGAKVKAKGQGKVTYARKSVVKKKFKKSFAVDKRTGRITVRKGTPKGTYKVTVKAVAEGNANYEKSARTAVVTIKVK